jgi:hypothetical protein
VVCPKSLESVGRNIPEPPSKIMPATSVSSCQIFSKPRCSDSLSKFREKKQRGNTGVRISSMAVNAGDDAYCLVQHYSDLFVVVSRTPSPKIMAKIGMQGRR